MQPQQIFLQEELARSEAEHSQETEDLSSRFDLAHKDKAMSDAAAETASLQIVGLRKEHEMQIQVLEMRLAASASDSKDSIDLRDEYMRDLNFTSTGHNEIEHGFKKDLAASVLLFASANAEVDRLSKNMRGIEVQHAMQIKALADKLAIATGEQSTPRDSRLMDNEDLAKAEAKVSQLQRFLSEAIAAEWALPEATPADQANLHAPSSSEFGSLLALDGPSVGSAIWDIIRDVKKTRQLPAIKEADEMSSKASVTSMGVETDDAAETVSRVADIETFVQDARGRKKEAWRHAEVLQAQVADLREHGTMTQFGIDQLAADDARIKDLKEEERTLRREKDVQRDSSAGLRQLLFVSEAEHAQQIELLEMSIALAREQQTEASSEKRDIKQDIVDRESAHTDRLDHMQRWLASVQQTIGDAGDTRDSLRQQIASGAAQNEAHVAELKRFLAWTQEEKWTSDQNKMWLNQQIAELKLESRTQISDFRTQMYDVGVRLAAAQADKSGVDDNMDSMKQSMLGMEARHASQIADLRQNVADAREMPWAGGPQTSSGGASSSTTGSDSPQVVEMQTRVASATKLVGELQRILAIPSKTASPHDSIPWDSERLSLARGLKGSAEWIPASSVSSTVQPPQANMQDIASLKAQLLEAEQDHRKVVEAIMKRLETQKSSSSDRGSASDP